LTRGVHAAMLGTNVLPTLLTTPTVAYCYRTGPTGLVRRCPLIGADQKIVAGGQYHAIDPNRKSALVLGLPDML